MKRDGGPAFPARRVVISTMSGEREEFIEGMSLRDFFAGQFLAAVKVEGLVEASVVAEHAYIMADAMLAERAK